MKLTFTQEESAFLRGLLKEHLDYYELLIGNSRATQKNRQTYAFIKTLWEKLNASPSAANS